MANGNVLPRPDPTPAGNMWKQLVHPAPAPRPGYPYTPNAQQDVLIRKWLPAMGLQSGNIEDYDPAGRTWIYNQALKREGGTWDGGEPLANQWNFIRSTNGFLQAVKNLTPQDTNAINRALKATGKTVFNLDPESIEGLGKPAKAGFTQAVNELKTLRDQASAMGYNVGQEGSSVRADNPFFTSLGGVGADILLKSLNEAGDLATGKDNFSIAKRFFERANLQAKADYVDRVSQHDTAGNVFVDPNIAANGEDLRKELKSRYIFGPNDYKLSVLPDIPEAELQGVEETKKAEPSPTVTPAPSPNAAPTAQPGATPWRPKQNAINQAVDAAIQGMVPVIHGVLQKGAELTAAPSPSPAPIATATPKPTPTTPSDASEIAAKAGTDVGGARVTEAEAAKIRAARQQPTPSTVAAPSPTPTPPRMLARPLSQADQQSTQGPTSENVEMGAPLGAHAGPISSYQEYANLPAGSRFTWAHDGADYWKPTA